LVGSIVNNIVFAISYAHSFLSPFCLLLPMLGKGEEYLLWDV